MAMITTEGEIITKIKLHVSKRMDTMLKHHPEEKKHAIKIQPWIRRNFSKTIKTIIIKIEIQEMKLAIPEMRIEIQEMRIEHQEMMDTSAEIIM